jgi:hypothetical protein
MRHLYALLLAPAVLLACGSSPEENAQTTSGDLVTCPPGQSLYCDVNEISGRRFCTCEPNVCTYSSYPATGIDAVRGVEVVLAWAVRTSGGYCPRISNSNGTWTDINDPLWMLPPVNGGVYGSTMGLQGLTPACSQTFGAGTSCCTYVWWPNATTSNPNQDPTGLCRANGEAFVAIEGLECVETKTNPCGRPGGGGCSTCQTVQP